MMRIRIRDTVRRILKNEVVGVLRRHSAVLLEGVARGVESGEPVLLVGETGVGKTASVQFLAQQTGRSEPTLYTGTYCMYLL